MIKNPSQLLERFRNAEGQEVSVDYFLYSCWEHEDLLKSKGKLNDYNGFKVGEHVHLDLSKQVKKLADWYLSEYSELGATQTVDFSRLDEVVKPSVLLHFDFLALVGEHLKAEISQDDRDRLWADVANILEGVFGRTGQLIWRYLKWSLDPVKEEVIEAGSRPPVGKYAPSYSSRPSPASGGSGGRDQRSKDGRPQGKSGPSRDSRPAPRGERPARNANPRNGAARPEGSRPQHSDDKPGRARNRDSRRPRSDEGSKLSAEAEADLLKEVLEGIQKIREGGATTQTLTPQNSFRRRIQHQMVANEGLFSHSTGDGPTRAVTISSVPVEVGDE